MSTPKHTKPKHVWVVEFAANGLPQQVFTTRQRAIWWTVESLYKNFYRVAKYVRATKGNK